MRFVGHLTASRLHAPEGAPGGRAPLLSVPAVCDTARRLRTRCCCMIQVQRPALSHCPAAASVEQLEGNKTRSWTGSVGSFGAGIVSTSRTRHRLFPDCSGPCPESSCPCAALTVDSLLSGEPSRAVRDAASHHPSTDSAGLQARASPRLPAQPSGGQPAAAKGSSQRRTTRGQQDAVVDGFCRLLWSGDRIHVADTTTSFPDCSGPSLEPALCKQCRPHADSLPLALARRILLAARLVARHGADKVGHVEDGIVFLSVPR